jgi:large subunit ribosomal protein L1
MVKSNMKKSEKNIIKSGSGKRIRAAIAKVTRDNFYSLSDAVDLVKSNATAKFDESLEVVLELGVDPRHSDQMVRGVVSMPNGTGKKVRVAVLAKENKQEEARAAGADIVGGEDLIEKIKAGEINFDRCVATPDMMAMLGSVAKILGPKGLMPNPKLGTVTMNVGEAVKLIKSGQVEFRVEKAGIVHAAFGKASFTAEMLKENLKALVDAVVKARPSGAKGTYLKEAHMCSSMGPSCKIDLTTISA